MKIGVIADIHSNFEALKAVLADLKEKKVKTLVNCGDIIGYGPERLPLWNLRKKNLRLSLP